MYVLIFFISSFLCGYSLSEKIKIISEKENQTWSRIAMSFGLGYLIYGWIAYIVSYLACVNVGVEAPKLYGNISAVTICLIIFFVLYALPRKHKNDSNYIFISDKKVFVHECISFGILFLAIFASMMYVFHVKDGILYSGASVFSDYSPHTAVIRSFSNYDNFPTQYPHYAGEDIKYHFMFQFLAGNLEWLGLRIDLAFNILSATSLWSFLVLLYYFAKSIAKTSAAGILTIAMFFCRSGFAFWGKLFECIKSGNFTEEFFQNSTFIGYTANENWGLWNYNVFLNQRHLGFGLLIGIIVIMYFSKYLTWIDEKNNLKIKNYIKESFLTKESWLPENPLVSILLGLILGSLAFWNGAVAVATLLILFGFAVMSKHKLNYLITALIAIGLSVIQKNFFIDSSVGQNIGVSYCWGFIAESTTIIGVLTYILKLTGIFFIGVVLFIIFIKGKKRILTIAFLLPFVFAFTVSMTTDITVNHKYIIIATIFLNIIWSYVIVSLWNKISTNNRAYKPIKALSKTAIVLLVFMLTCTGIYDLLTIYNNNKSTISVDLNSGLTQWLTENISDGDLVLTNEESMSEITLAGIPLYCGWPYYAWSAGYDTDTRALNALSIYTVQDKDYVSNLVKSEGITYILYQDGMTYEDNECTDKIIKSLYECVYDDGYTQIYDTSMSLD